MRLRTRLTALILAVAASLGVASLAAPDDAQARTFYLYANGFSPSYAEDGSGVIVRFFNFDSIPHRVVSYQVYGAQPWSLDVTVQPWQGYTVPERLYCTYPSCSWQGVYFFREPERSQIVSADGYSYCQGYCGELWVRH
jgi:hypothetical protein